jgi:Icc protein
MALRLRKAQSRPTAEGSLAAPLPTRSLLQVSDLHLLEDPKARLLGIDTGASFDAVLAAAFQRVGSIDAVVVTGDIAHEPTIATYERAREILWRYHRGPSMWLPGNHDVSRLMGRTLPTVSELSLGSWRIFAMDTHIDEVEQGTVGVQELDRVKTAVAATDAAHVVLAGHHPCVPVGTPWLDPGCIENGTEVLDLLCGDSRIAAYVFGHIHHAGSYAGATCPMLSAPSTCFQFAQGGARFGIAGDAPGARVFELDADGGLRTEIVRADYDLKVDLSQFR